MVGVSMLCWTPTARVAKQAAAQGIQAGGRHARLEDDLQLAGEGALRVGRPVSQR
jgi:hypothetical protein